MKRGKFPVPAGSCRSGGSVKTGAGTRVDRRVGDVERLAARSIE